MRTVALALASPIVTPGPGAPEAPWSSATQPQLGSQLPRATERSLQPVIEALPYPGACLSNARAQVAVLSKARGRVSPQEVVLVQVRQKGRESLVVIPER